MAQKLRVIGRHKGTSHDWFTSHNNFRAQKTNKAVSPVIRQPNTKAVVTTAVFADYVIVSQLSMYHPGQIQPHHQALLIIDNPLSYLFPSQSHIGSESCPEATYSSLGGALLWNMRMQTSQPLSNHEKAITSKWLVTFPQPVTRQPKEIWAVNGGLWCQTVCIISIILIMLLMESSTKL